LPAEHESIEPSPDEVRAQLDRIFASSAFRNSKRLPRFLNFIAERTLSGNAGEIKERLIGIEVFGRPPDYDLASDPAVRVAAGEIRKRLAQYYVQPGHEEELRCELVPGSYIPIFRWQPPARNAKVQTSSEAVQQDSLAAKASTSLIGEPTETPSGAKSTGKIKRMSLLAGGLLFLIILAAWLLVRALHLAPNELNALWRPVWESSSNTVLCVGDLNYLMAVRSSSVSQGLESVMGTRNHVGPNDTLALTRLTGQLARNDRHFTVLLADNTTLTDLRTQPAVLIGAFTNRWTEQLLENARFSLILDPVSRVGIIRDKHNLNNMSWTIDFNSPLASIHRDYALVTRVRSPLTGQTDLIIAGIGPYGTVAASEFVTNPDYFKEFASRAPKGWEDKDVQIVLTTEVIDGRSAPPKVMTFDVH
jgi:hypothetical protein